jgi:hypothetical protein
MLTVNLLLPCTMICFGRIFLKKAPKEINSIYGYRSTMSMKNKDTWEFAHHYFGIIWYKWGLILLLLSIVVMIFVIGKDTDTVGSWGGVLCLLQCIPLVGAIFPTEQALRRTFDKNGVRK